MKPKRILLIVVVMLMTFHAQLIYAQPQIQWQRSYGGSSRDVSSQIFPTKDGGYIVAAYTLSSDEDVVPMQGNQGNYGGGDCWIIKLSNIGNIEWQRSLGGSKYDYASSIIQTKDGGYIVAGSSESKDGDAAPMKGDIGNQGLTDLWIIKLDNTGKLGQAPNIEWQTCYGRSEREYAESIIETIDGGYAIAGNSESVVVGHHGSFDYWVIKLDNTGKVGHAPNFEWEGFYGGSSDDFAKCIIQTIDGGYIIAGMSNSNDLNVAPMKGYPGNHGYFDCWIVKLDNTGKVGWGPPRIEWQISYGGSSRELFNSIVQTKDGGYILAVSSLSKDGDVAPMKGDIGNQGLSDFWIIKLDNTGKLGQAPNIEWQKCYGGNNCFTESRSIAQTIDGGYIIAGLSSCNNGDAVPMQGNPGNHGSFDYWIVKLDNTGKPNHAPNIEWQRYYGGKGWDEPESIVQTIDGGYIIAGNSTSQDGDVAPMKGNSGNHGDNDLWIVKLEPTCTRASIDISTTLDSVCQNTPVNFTAIPINGGNNPIYQWKINGNNVGNNSAIFTTTNLQDGDKVSCEMISNGKPCIVNNPAISNTIQMTVLTNTIPIISASGPTNFCQGESVTLTSSPALSYLWSPNGETSQSIIVKTPGTYAVTVTNSPQCKSTSTVQSVSVKADVNLGPDGIRSIGQQIQPNEVNPNADVNINPNDYEFTWSDGTNIIHDPTYTISELCSKTYTVTVTHKQTGCEGSSTAIFKAFLSRDNYSYGGDAEEKVYSSIKTFDGGYIMAGYTSSPSNNGDITNNHGQKDMWVVKTDAMGNKEWETSSGGDGDEEGRSIIQTPEDGGYIIAGYTTSQANGIPNGDIYLNHGGRDIYVVKIDAKGRIIWSNTYGGSSEDVANGIVELWDNKGNCTGYAILGSSNSNDWWYSHNNGHNKGTYDMCLMSIDKNGQQMGGWGSLLGGTNNEEGNSLFQTADGGIIVAGTTSSNDNHIQNHGGNSGTQDILVYKFDNTGKFQWQRTYGGSNNEDCNSIIQTRDLGYVLAGYTQSKSNDGDIEEKRGGMTDIWVIKIKPDANKGEIEWQKTYGGEWDELANNIIETSDGGYAIAGSKSIITPSSSYINYEILKIKPDYSNSSGQKIQGELSWEKQIGGNGVDRATNIIEERGNKGAYTVIGYSTSTEGNGITLSGHTGQMKRDGSYEYWMVQLLTCPEEAPEQKTQKNNEGITQLNTNTKVQIAPNPFTQKATLTLNNIQPNKKYTLVITDIYGRRVRQINNITTSTIQINRGNLTAGIYQYQILDGTNIIATNKMVIE